MTKSKLDRWFKQTQMQTNTPTLYHDLIFFFFYYLSDFDNQNPIDRWMKGFIPSLPKKGWPRISQELPRYNTYIHSSQNLQCPTTKPYRTQNWSLEKTKMASEKIDPRPHKYWPSLESLKACGQKTYWWHYYLSTLPRPSISFTEGRWNKSY